MAKSSEPEPAWSDSQLTEAVATSRSWRGVMRELGLHIVDGDLAMYLIPSQVIAGRVQILLRTYGKYIVGNAAGLMTPKAA